MHLLTVAEYFPGLIDSRGERIATTRHQVRTVRKGSVIVRVTTTVKTRTTTIKPCKLGR